MLDLLAAHVQVLDELLPQGHLVGLGDDQLKVLVVFGLEQRLDRGLDLVLLQLRKRQAREHLVVPELLRKIVRALQVLQLLDEHGHRLRRVVELLVHRERLLVQAGRDADVRNVARVVLVQTLNVVHHPALVRLNGRQDKKVLQVDVGAELGRLQHDLLQQLDQFVLQVRVHEGTHRARHLLRVVRLRQGRLDHLRDELRPVHVVGFQNAVPQRRVLPLHQIAGLILVQAVLVGHRHQLLVAAAALVGDKRKVRIAALRVFAHRPAFVELVLHQELARILAGVVNVDLGQRVEQRRLVVALLRAGLQPVQDELQAVALLDLLNQRRDRARVARAHY
mmetsp:Transcript_13917/g.39577  ORF Transcript_13917/g.39577 Transcript_13917/m.39577 type:complete len:336 (-) Transcript_13917:2744-3751(-)